MAEYIERERARREFLLYFRNEKSIVGECDDLLCYLPAADVVEVRHGEWVAKEVMIKNPLAKNYYCSECKSDTNNCGNYCPNCGAKMDGKGEGE